MKFWAYYGTVAEFHLLSDVEYKQERAKTGDETRQDLNDFQPFKSLHEAKGYLKMHIKGDIADLRRAHADVMAYRKRKR